MTRFLFSLLQLRQRTDEGILFESRKARPNPAKLAALYRRKQALARKVSRSLGRELLAGA